MRSDWRSILEEVYRGQSVGRSLMHLNIKSDVTIRGNVLDIGGGHRQTYLDLMRLSSAERFTVIDLQPSPRVDALGSVTCLPLKSGSIDTVLCFNLLEHIFNHKAAFHEISRVMKPGALLYGWVPFIIGVHGDPDDYYRYTPNALNALLSESGLTPVVTKSSGGVFLSTFDLLRPYIRGRFIGKIMRVAGAATALSATWLFNRLYRDASRLNPASCPTGIWFIAKQGE